MPSGQNNVNAGSGGVIQGNAAQSTTTIANNTTADVGSEANINVTGSVPNPGRFVLYALNNVDGTDTVNLDTGGLIDGSNATSTIDADTNNATVEIGPGASHHHGGRRRPRHPHHGEHLGRAHRPHLRPGLARDRSMPRRRSARPTGSRSTPAPSSRRRAT